MHLKSERVWHDMGNNGFVWHLSDDSLKHRRPLASGVAYNQIIINIRVGQYLSHIVLINPYVISVTMGNNWLGVIIIVKQELAKLRSKFFQLAFCLWKMAHFGPSHSPYPYPLLPIHRSNSIPTPDICQCSSFLIHSLFNFNANQSIVH